MRRDTPISELQCCASDGGWAWSGKSTWILRFVNTIHPRRCNSAPAVTLQVVPGVSRSVRDCILVIGTPTCPCTNTAAESAASVLRCCVAWRTPIESWNVRNAGQLKWNGCYRPFLPGDAVRPAPGPANSLEPAKERPVRPSTDRTSRQPSLRGGGEPGGGMGCKRTCGALTGATVVLGLDYGRTSPDEPAKKVTSSTNVVFAR